MLTLDEIKKYDAMIDEEYLNKIPYDELEQIIEFKLDKIDFKRFLTESFQPIYKLKDTIEEYYKDDLIFNIISDDELESYLRKKYNIHTTTTTLICI